jgi:adenosylcobyric acid synthase
MLGRQISDPDGVEGASSTVEGLGLLALDTVLGGDKMLRSVTGTTCRDAEPFSGYEMHLGQTRGDDSVRPFARLSDGRSDGATSADGRVAGTYVHGLFSNDRQRASWLARFGGAQSSLNYEEDVETTLDALAVHLEKHVNVDALLSLAR